MERLALMHARSVPDMNVQQIFSLEIIERGQRRLDPTGEMLASSAVVRKAAFEYVNKRKPNEEEYFGNTQLWYPIPIVVDLDRMLVSIEGIGKDFPKVLAEIPEKHVASSRTTKPLTIEEKAEQLTRMLLTDEYIGENSFNAVKAKIKETLTSTV